MQERTIGKRQQRTKQELDRLRQNHLKEQLIAGYQQLGKEDLETLSEWEAASIK